MTTESETNANLQAVADAIDAMRTTEPKSSNANRDLTIDPDAVADIISYRLNDEPNQGEYSALQQIAIDLSQYFAEIDDAERFDEVAFLDRCGYEV